ncbi:hypothetical protein EDC04DRAFT_2577849 [Pisolithus marmoratus]|nr:hypothetical protein EDC04DRAFT_2577849 [Pisolithus marmoratus]
MSTAPPGFNYAKAYGIESVAGAVVFAIIYVPLFFLYIRQAIVRPTYVFIVIAFFCAVRIAAFILRALLAAVVTDGQNLNLFITYEIMYNVGFFGLLYSAYSLVVDRGLVSDLPLPSDPISKLTRRRMVFRLLLTAAVTVGITGVIEAAVGGTQHTVDIGNALRKASLYMFLILCILVALQAVLLVRAEALYGTYKVSEGTFGARHGIYVLCLISLLLVTRQSFFAATVNNTARQNDEHLWYPLAALPELCAVLLFAVPGLVPSLAELPS